MRASGVVPIWLWKGLRTKRVDSVALVQRQVGLGPRMSLCVSSSPKARKKLMYQFKGSQANVPIYSQKGQPFCSIQIFNRPSEARLHIGGKSAVWSLPIQIWRSSRFPSQTGHIHSNVWPNFWAPHNPVTLTNKINCHRCSVITWQGLKSSFSLGLR